MLGDDRCDPLAGVGPAVRSPVAALEAVLLPLLSREPCCVSFSGGRDSSLLLAVATRLARREGLPAPLALCYRFRDPRADEPAWQRLVLDALEIERSEWIEVGEELDLLGPIARDLASRHGRRFPANATSTFRCSRSRAAGC